MRWHDNGLDGLTYDDVLIRPAYSELDSRQDADYSVEAFKSSFAPVIAANMKTIATVEMAKALWPMNIPVPSHRFQTSQEQVTYHIDTDEDSAERHWVSIGLNERFRLDECFARLLRPTTVMLELAHCDSKAAIEEIKWLKSRCYFIIAGNVATADACKRLFDAGADMCKIGIGNGGVCTTRLVTGCGVSQLSAIAECAAVGPVIADGGIRNSGDAVKALVAGAKFVMVGALLAGTDEAAGEPVHGSSNKIYYGMASREAGKVANGNIPEGIATNVPYTGSATKVMQDFLAGIRQGMAMVGARTLDELRENAVFQRVSPATLVENIPHATLR